MYLSELCFCVCVCVICAGTKKEEKSKTLQEIPKEEDEVADKAAAKMATDCASASASVAVGWPPHRSLSTVER